MRFYLEREKLPMRIQKFLVVAFLATFATAVAHTTPLPVGTYWLSATTPLSGIHSGSDIGNLTGTLTFDAASNITFANLVFDDLTSGKAFTFTNPGPIEIDIPPGLLYSTIYNAADPHQYFAFSVHVPSSSPSGRFTLTCGVDCDNWMEVDDGERFLTYVEVTGSMDPVPEPSTLTLLVAGLVSARGVFRAAKQRALTGQQ
jgi:hypothetical protein